MNIPRYLVVIASIITLSACDQIQTNSQHQAIEKLKKEVEDLRKEISSEKSKAELNYVLLKFRQERFEDTVFDPSESSGYGKLETTAGDFLVALREVTPYLDGVRVKLDFANIQSARYDGFEIEAEYGMRQPKYDVKEKTEDYNEKMKLFKASIKTKTQKFTNTLNPGSWNFVFMNLPGIKPDQFGYLKISMSTDQVSLKRN